MFLYILFGNYINTGHFQLIVCSYIPHFYPISIFMIHIHYMQYQKYDHYIIYKSTKLINHVTQYFLDKVCPIYIHKYQIQRFFSNGFSIFTCSFQISHLVWLQIGIFA